MRVGETLESHREREGVAACVCASGNAAPRIERATPRRLARHPVGAGCAASPGGQRGCATPGFALVSGRYMYIHALEVAMRRPAPRSDLMARDPYLAPQPAQDAAIPPPHEATAEEGDLTRIPVRSLN